MKNNITYWLKQLILLVLVLVQVGNVYSAPEVLAGTEITSVESAQGQQIVNSWRRVKDLPNAIKLNPKILDELISWSDEAVTILRQKVNQYPGLAIELSRKLKLGELELDMIQYFKRFHDDDYIKFSMAGFSKRGANPLGEFPEFRKMIDDTEVIPGGDKFKQLNLDVSSGRYLGKVFDDVIERKITDAWLSGNFDNLKSPLKEKIKSYKDNGFQMVIQGKVKIAGRSPEPDILFIPSIKSNGELKMDFSKVEYPDIKYLWDVNFTSAQRKITSNLPATVTVNGSRPFQLIKNGEEIFVEAGEVLIITKAFKLAPTENMILDLIPHL